jgi:HAMP domain-containing protein
VSINTLIDDLVWPTTEVTRAVGAVAKGDLGSPMALEVDGRRSRASSCARRKLVNKMIDQLSVFTSEVTRVAREVGTEGKLGGQAQVKGVSGVWKDLTESVNQMAGNLTAQVRNIAEVTIAVADGDLSKKITVDVRGEILQLKEAINTMVDQLRSFASEVTRGRTRGRHRGQARRTGGRPGVAGTWKDLTDNVNLLAANLDRRCATSPRSRRPWRAATCRARSRSTSRARSSSSRTPSTRWSTSSTPSPPR